MEDDRFFDILLKEYVEAGTLCRNSEQLTRTSLSLFIPLAAALAGLVVSVYLDVQVKLALSVAGLVYALLLVNTVHRHTAYYEKYVTRAKEIESLITRNGNPIMRLYSIGATATSESRTFSNKHAIAAAFWIAAAYFAVAAFYYAYRAQYIYFLIAAAIIFTGYIILWTSPSFPGGWKNVGNLRRWAFYFSLWFMAFLLLALFSFGLGTFLLQASFYYFLPVALCAAIAGSIVFVEIIGVTIKKSMHWSDRKRLLFIAVLAVLQFVFSTTVALIVKSNMAP